ncbi:NAD(P)-binding protein, partial [Yamadazyma tenuis ATCC 10573]
MFNSPILESTSPVYQNYKTTQLELIPKPINLTKKLDGTYGAGQDDVLVKIHYASFNPIDILLKGIVSPWVNYLRGNFGLCNDYSGVVVDIGDKAAEKLGLRIGDEVCGQTSQTAYTNTLTEYVMFEGSHYPKGWGMLKKPENLTMAEAGSFGMVYSTAVLLKKTAVFNESTKVLVNGASTSVGKYLISLLKLDPRATEVVAICSGRSAPLIKELGAHKIIDYTQTNSIVNEVLDECKDRLFDVYFDCRGNDKLLYHVTFFLKEDGVYASCGGGKKLDLANA